MLVTLVLGCQLVLCTLAAFAFARYEFRGQGVAFALVLAQLMIMPDVLIVENYRTMAKLGILELDPGDRAALCRFGVRHLPASPDVQAGAERTRRRGARGRRLAAADAAAGLCAARPAGLSRLCAGVRQLPLEQFPVAADRHQFGRGTAPDRGPASVLLDRPGHRLVGDLRRDADDHRRRCWSDSCCSSASSSRASCARGSGERTAQPRPSIASSGPFGSGTRNQRSNMKNSISGTPMPMPTVLIRPSRPNTVMKPMMKIADAT